MKIIENHEDYVIVEDTLINGDHIHIIPPFEGAIFVDEPDKSDTEKVREFAKRFCNDNKDLLKRLADK
jgi:hypothetical protein